MITVICPVYNEENYVSNVIEFFIGALPEQKELIIIDGGSTDNTRKIAHSYIARHSNIRILDNPGKYVPFALNLAIQSSNGDPVIRLDAHTTYAPDYFTTILETFEKTGADIVGGPMRAVGNTPFQMAVAIATSTKMGIGDSSFHDENYEGYADSVYLGAWRRSIFKETGFFDTEMLRNQDDEFHYRAKSKGKKIYLNPAIKSWYSPRSSLSSLFRQYYQYGLFKPLVLKKVKSGLQARHLIPAAFVIYLFTLIFFLSNFILWLPLLLYVLLEIYFAVSYGKKIPVIIRMLIVYPALHISYGSGFLKGMLLLWLNQKPKI